MGDLDDVTTEKTRAVLPSAQPMYEAAERWRDDFLLGNRSLFSGAPLDAAAAVQELVDAYVLQPDVGSGTFYDKLEQQLAGVTPSAVQLAAELLFVHYLIASPQAARAETKRRHIESVLAYRQSGTSTFPEKLFPALDGGVANPGTAYNTYRWKMLAYLIRFVEMLITLPVPEREAALTNWGTFQEVLDRLDDQSVWTQRYALEHLLFPGWAPKAVSRDDRQAISKGFAPRFGAVLPVEQIAQRLEPNARYGDRACVDFYLPPYREQWEKGNPKMATYANWARCFLGNYQECRPQWEACAGSAGEVVRAAGSGADILGPLRRALSEVEGVSAFFDWVTEDDGAARHALAAFTEFRGLEAMDQFVQRVPADALAGGGIPLVIGSALLMGQDAEQFPLWPIASASTTHRLTGGYGVKPSAAVGEKHDMYLHWLGMIQVALGTPEEPWGTRLDAAVLADLMVRTERPDGWADDEWRSFDAWRTGKTVALTAQDKTPAAASVIASTATPAAEAPSSGSFEDLVAALSLDEQGADWLEETLALLQLKKQLILQGPPGTGKTYLARTLAEFLAGDAERVVLTQFHPGTSYEDFVQGLRPDPENPTSFRVVDGPLLRLAKEARAHPENTYVLLVDEINRGNIPAVFGELYYLLEYRDQAVTLTYGQDFSLPGNIFLIGTMNTADRSITALDSALRRRFYVRDLRPGETPVDGMLRNHLAQHDTELEWLAELLDRANGLIKDRDQHVGPSHFMGAQMDETHARRAWDYTVMPTLREVFYRRPELLGQLEFATLKAAVTHTAGDAAAD